MKCHKRLLIKPGKVTHPLRLTDLLMRRLEGNYGSASHALREKDILFR